MGWAVVNLAVVSLAIRNQFQVPLAIAVNRQQIIECAVHFDRVKIVLVHLFLSVQPTLPKWTARSMICCRFTAMASGT